MLKLKRNVVKARPIGCVCLAACNIYKAVTVSFWNPCCWSLDKTLHWHMSQVQTKPGMLMTKQEKEIPVRCSRDSLTTFSMFLKLFFKVFIKKSNYNFVSEVEFAIGTPSWSITLKPHWGSHFWLDKMYWFFL